MGSCRRRWICMPPTICFLPSPWPVRGLSLIPRGERAPAGPACSLRGMRSTRAARRERERGPPDRSLLTLRQRYQDAVQSLTNENLKLLREWPQRLKSITDEHFSYDVRGKAVTGENYRQSLSHQPIPKIAAPTYKSWGELLNFLGKENLPGSYPYTGGVYPYRRTGEDPIRMFAGEGTPERTNRRFHYLVGRPAGRAPVHRLRQRHPVRRRPGAAPGHLRQDRQLRRQHPHAGRHEEAVFRLRPVLADHLRVDDHQRPGADDPGHVHEHRHRPAGGAVPARKTSSAGSRRRKPSTRFSKAASVRSTTANCRRPTTASAWACSASPANRSSMPTPMRGSRRRP